MFKHILEVKAEIAMYNKVLMFLQSIFGKPKETASDRRIGKINKIAIQTFIDLMIKNREYFIDLMDGKIYEDDRLLQKLNGEFFMKEGWNNERDII